MRSSEDKLIDRLLQLYILGRTQELHDGIAGATILQKLCFLSEWRFFEEEMNGLHYTFYKYSYGPFSKGVVKDFNFLVSQGKATKSTYKLTTYGRTLVDAFFKYTGNFSDNKRFFNILDEIIKKWGNISTDKMKSQVYRMRIRPHTMQNKDIFIKDIPKYCDIFVPKQFASFKKRFRIPSDLFDDFTYELWLDEKRKVKQRMNSGESYEGHFGKARI